jgi:hypothetical protein
MSTLATTTKDTNLAKTDKVDLSNHENQKAVENHKKAAEHYQLAAKHHLEAARHHEAGAHDKVAESTLAAHGHSLLARGYQKEDAKRYAVKNK